MFVIIPYFIRYYFIFGVYMIVLIIFFVLLFLFFKFFKIPKIGNLALITGGVKTGKTLLSVHCTRKIYKRIVRSTKFINFFRKMFGKETFEIPLFYSNIPLGFDYVEVTEDMLLLKERCVWGSVMYIDEASLFADSQLINDKVLNSQLLLFNKLCAHFGLSLLMYDTQCICDIHYSIKRSLSNYFYIHHKHVCLILPFVILYVQEYRYSDDGTVIAVTGNKDLEENLKRVIVPKKIFKYYDSKCYRKIVDGLPVNRNVIHSTPKSDLTCNKIISFRKEFTTLVKHNYLTQNNLYDFKEKFLKKIGVEENEKTKTSI